MCTLLDFFVCNLPPRPQLSQFGAPLNYRSLKNERLNMDSRRERPSPH